MKLSKVEEVFTFYAYKDNIISITLGLSGKVFFSKREIDELIYKLLSIRSNLLLW